MHFSRDHEAVLAWSNGDLLFNIGNMTSLKSSLSSFHPDMTLDLYNVADYVEAMCLSVPFQT